MDTIKIKLCTAIFLSAFSMNAAAVSVEITQSSLFLSADGTTYQDDQLGFYSVSAPKTNTFGGGFDVSFYDDDLDTDNLGSMTWHITNNTGGIISSARFMGFLDAEVGTNQFWDEYGALVGDVSGTYDSWEIDEPGYLDPSDPSYPLNGPNDIYSHLQGSGLLDNTNNVPIGTPEDVSLALGFDINDWLAGETLVARFLISGTLPSIAALAQHDALTDEVIYFSGSGSVSVIPIPGTGGLMLTGLALMALARRRKKINQLIKRIKIKDEE